MCPLRLYHVLLDVFILRHLDERLEEPGVMLDEDLAGFSVPTLKHTTVMVTNVNATPGGFTWITCSPGHTNPEG